MFDALSLVLCLKPFPGYNYDSYPFVLARESSHICLINTKRMIITKIIDVGYTWHYSFQNVVSFCTNDKNNLAFVSIGPTNFEMHRYEIDSKMMEALALE